MAVQIKTRILSGIALILILAGTEQAQANSFKTGNDLLQYCEDASQPVCTAYIMGVVDSISVYQQVTSAPKFACVPTHVTAGQVRDIVVRYLKAHPQDRHLTASGEVIMALKEVWPCK
jgi:hypothetical protein